MSDLIAATCSQAPRLIDGSHGLPEGWIGFADVVPDKAFPFVPGGGILNILRPSPRIEIEFEGGVRLERATWLAGRPPTVRVYGDTTLSPVEIDGHPAQRLSDGAFVTVNMTTLGTHVVSCAGTSRAYAIQDGITEWHSWPAHPTGLPDAEGTAPFICGALVTGSLPNNAMAQRSGSIAWCLRQSQETTEWTEETLHLSTIDFEASADTTILFRWPENRWLNELSLSINGHLTRLTTAPPTHELVVPLQTLRQRWSDELEQNAVVLSSRFGISTVALVHQAWRVKDLQCVQELAGNEQVLQLTWKDIGGAVDRTLTLYQDPRMPLFSTKLESDQNAVTSRFRGNALPAGRYVVEMAGYDQAGVKPTLRSYPITIDILGIDQVLQHGRVKLCRAQTSEGTYELDEVQYEITVTGRITTGQPPAELREKYALVKAINEGWYVGKLTVREAPRDITSEYVENPIKFEFDSERKEIIAIEDKTGDGAIFCPMCKRIFWTRGMEKAERRKRHKRILTTEFTLSVTTKAGKQ